ncbi:hypothetical protein DN752_19795 [Echinicola strongylocentroti]|uniref:DUF5018 domain-containing protein n=1 Tax=Echinicola strongylocentroti TaxID=1795355 RepID=A0A2Z4IM57_9BACT|nr:hypothetical protein [Echinicola strongylocentroti]AWW32201.1 hypothetical protein DN752_19795 [Echinicola strongylocentroti]
MKNKIVLVVLALAMVSCGQRVELDEGQWGVHADITSGAFFYKWELNDITLAEGDVEGARREDVTVSTDVNTENQQVVTTINAEEDLSRMACYIYHDGVKVEPLAGAPALGVVSDYSTGEFTYRIYSANGEFKDWTIVVTQ